MEKYQMRKAEARKALPEIDLLPPIAHKRQQLDMALFGPNTYRGNIQNMLKSYFHSKEFPNIIFTPATTTESISAVAQNFADFAKPKIFDPKWLQAGWIVRTQEGVFVNPLDSQGNPITNEKLLKSLLKSNKKRSGIYLLDNGASFAPYDSFTRGVQDCDTFAKGGLARALEYTSYKEAKNLRAIASPQLYNGGVNVWGFDDVKESVLRVVSLYSNGDLGDDRLGVDGDFWVGGYGGYAFGVLNRSARGALPKK